MREKQERKPYKIRLEDRVMQSSTRVKLRWWRNSESHWRVAIKRGKQAGMKVPECKEEKVLRKMGPAVYSTEQLSKIRTVEQSSEGLGLGLSDKPPYDTSFGGYI